MEQPEAGYREIEHTADWQLEVWAPDLPALLEQAARGMYALSGAKLGEGPQVSRRFDVFGFDSEGFLVGFLSELLYLTEQEGLAFDQYFMEVEWTGHLSVEVSGRQLVSLEKEIKAVTYHNLKVEKGPRGLQATIVFDV